MIILVFVLLAFIVIGAIISEMKKSEDYLIEEVSQLNFWQVLIDDQRSCRVKWQIWRLYTINSLKDFKDNETLTIKIMIGLFYIIAAMLLTAYLLPALATKTIAFVTVGFVLLSLCDAVLRMLEWVLSMNPLSIITGRLFDVDYSDESRISFKEAWIDVVILIEESDIYRHTLPVMIFLCGVFSIVAAMSVVSLLPDIATNLIASITVASLMFAATLKLVKY